MPIPIFLEGHGHHGAGPAWAQNSCLDSVRCSLGFNKFALGRQKHNACVAEHLVHRTWLLAHYWYVTGVDNTQGGRNLTVRSIAFLWGAPETS